MSGDSPQYNLVDVPPIATLMSADDGAEVAVVAVLTSLAFVLGSGVTSGAQKLAAALCGQQWPAPCMWDLTALMTIEATLIFFLQYVQQLNLTVVFSDRLQPLYKLNLLQPGIRRCSLHFPISESVCVSVCLYVEGDTSPNRAFRKIGCCL